MLMLENDENKARAMQKAVNRVSHQRERSIKEEINHDEKFREMYAKRLRKNTKRLEHALPDQRPSYQELVSFDQDRVKHWVDEENAYQQKLQHTIGDDDEQKVRAEKRVATLAAKVIQLHAQIDGEKSRAGFKNARLENEQENIRGTIRNDVKLDDKRRHNEEIEARRAEESQVEQDQYTNKKLLQKK